MPTFTLEKNNGALVDLKKALDQLWDRDLLGALPLDYALDETRDNFEQALSTFEAKKEELLAEHQKADEHGRRYFTSSPVQTTEGRRSFDLRAVPQVGMEILARPYSDQEKGFTSDEKEWQPLNEHPVGSAVNQFQYAFESDEAEEAFQDGMDELREIDNEVVLSLVTKDTFLDANDQISREELRGTGLFRIVRRLLVEGNQGWAGE